MSNFENIRKLLFGHFTCIFLVYFTIHSHKRKKENMYAPPTPQCTARNNILISSSLSFGPEPPETVHKSTTSDFIENKYIWYGVRQRNTYNKILFAIKCKFSFLYGLLKLTRLGQWNGNRCHEYGRKQIHFNVCTVAVAVATTLAGIRCTGTVKAHHTS